MSKKSKNNRYCHSDLLQKGHNTVYVYPGGGYWLESITTNRKALYECKPLDFDSFTRFLTIDKLEKIGYE